MALINFIVALQCPRQRRRQRRLFGIGELGAAGGDVEHEDPLFALRADQDEVDVAALMRDDPADPVQQPDLILLDDLEDGVAPRRMVVAVDDRRKMGDPAAAVDEVAAAMIGL